MVSMCACQGNFGSVNLNESIEIPGNGIIKESILKKIQAANAIGVFTGESNGHRYEWTIFGSDITEAGEINLAVTITKTLGGDPKVTLSTSEPFGFPHFYPSIWTKRGMPKVQPDMQTKKPLHPYLSPEARPPF